MCVKLSSENLNPGSFHPRPTNTYTYRMCLFGGEIEWMKNSREKMRRKIFLMGVWLEGGEGKKIGRTWVFSL